MDGLAPFRPTRYRTIFISDIHLGTRGCKADYLLDFIKNTDCETMYLVGDIVDGWRLKRTWYWPQAHNDVTSAGWKCRKKRSTKPLTARSCW